MVLDDLKEIKNFGIIGVPNLDTVSMKQVERVDSVDIFANLGTTVNFPVLKNANYLFLRGNVSRYVRPQVYESFLSPKSSFIKLEFAILPSSFNLG